MCETAVTLSVIQLHGASWNVLSFGNGNGVRWHTDASDREIAFAFRAFADKLDPINEQDHC